MSSAELTSDSFLYSASLRLAATTFIAGVSWGIMTSLFVVCIYSLVRAIRLSKKATSTSNVDIILTGCITIMWTSSTISTIANAYYDIYAFSWQMNYPGGPVAFINDSWNQPIPILALWTYILTIWFADGLILWRIVVFYHGVHHVVRILVLSVAFLIYIGMIGTSCFSFAIASTNQSLYSKIGIEAGTPVIVLSMALTVYVTALILIRLLLFKRWVRKTLGMREGSLTLPYTNIAAMLIESSALYAMWSIVFIVLFVMNNPGEFIIDMTLCHVQVISPILIVYRVSRGLAWERTTSINLATLTQMSFADGRSDEVVEQWGTPEQPREEESSDTALALPTQLALRPETV